MSQVQPDRVAASMEQPHLSRPAQVRREFANLVSVIIHPLVFPLLTIIVVGYSLTQNIAKTLFMAGLTLLVISVPVALIVWVQVKRGVWSDLDVSQRQQRYLLYPISLACMGLLAYIYHLLQAPGQAIRAVIGLAFAGIIDGVINFFWKVSAHATTAAACAALLWQLVPGTAWGPSAAAGAALVGWSRVELQHHTKGQVVAGWFVGASSTVLALNLFR